jgi:hypothetical protein
MGFCGGFVVLRSVAMKNHGTVNWMVLGRNKWWDKSACGCSWIVEDEVSVGKNVFCASRLEQRAVWTASRGAV